MIEYVYIYIYDKELRTIAQAIINFKIWSSGNLGSRPKQLFTIPMC